MNVGEPVAEMPWRDVDGKAAGAGPMREGIAMWVRCGSSCS